jgi:hypothetical protein
MMKQDQEIEVVLKSAREIETRMDCYDFGDRVDRQEPAYYSARFINSVLNGGRRATLKQAQDILQTLEGAYDQLLDEEGEANDRGYDDEPGDRPGINS